MKTLKYIFLLAAFATLGLSSCTKEDKIVDETENPTEVTPETGVSNPLMDNISSRSDGTLDLGCFSIDYPFSFSIDGENVEINNEADFTSVLENLDEESLIDFAYPLAITYDDGSTASLANGEELGLAFVSCLPDDGWSIDSTYNGEDLFPAFLITSEEYCFDFVYPLGLSDVEGNTSSAASEEELIELIADAQGLLFFDFPISVIDEDGVVSALNGSDALFEMLLSCDEGSFGGGYDTIFTFGGEIGCYSIEYPFSVVLADGSTVQVSSHDEFCVLMLEGDFVDFVYPLTLTNIDGEVFTINSQEELEAALEDCWDVGPILDLGFYVLLDSSSDTGFDCYSINYPINVIIDGVTVVVDNFEEAVNVASQSTLVQLQYPVSVTIIESGEEVLIEDFDGLYEVLSDCE